MQRFFCRGKNSRLALLLALVPLGAPSWAPAQAPPPPAAEASVAPGDPFAALEREIAQLKADYEARLTALEARLAALAEAPPPVSTPPAPAPPVASGPAPISILSGAGGKNFLNLSLDGLIAAGTSTEPEVPLLQTGGHDPGGRGFTVQNVEMVLEGAVDPYFRGQANVVMQISPEGETVVELEEAYATTTSLPHGLQVKAGQFLTEFGRLNPSHPHSWDFVDQPLVLGRFFGGDGLRSVGARISWLLPTDFYSEAFLTLQNSHGETLTSFRGPEGDRLFGRELVATGVETASDLLVVPRWAASFDLNDSQTLLFGASAALGPNGTGPEGKTRIYGVDGFWKWKAPNAFKGFPFVKVQGELLYRDLFADEAVDLAAPATNFDDWGGYLQVNWGFRPGYVAGLRVDRVGGDAGDPGAEDPALAARLRLSPALTWFPTEYSKLRLQYNYDRGDAFVEDAHSLWLQLEFLLGAHSAHKF